MKIFLSWSGERSLNVAKALRDYIPLLLPQVEPYVSSEDIDKGTRWSTDIAKELEDSNFGIICITKENVTAPWVMFEAGALSKSMDSSRVVPFLLDLKPSELAKSPLHQFQMSYFSMSDLGKLFVSVNKSLGEDSIKPERLEILFEKFWPDIEGRLKDIRATAGDESKVAVEQDGVEGRLSGIEAILEELVVMNTAQTKSLSNSNVSQNVAELFHRLVDRDELQFEIDRWRRRAENMSSDRRSFMVALREIMQISVESGNKRKDELQNAVAKIRELSESAVSPQNRSINPQYRYHRRPYEGRLIKPPEQPELDLPSEDDANDD